jgi:hypothetical protein
MSEEISIPPAVLQEWVKSRWVDEEKGPRCKNCIYADDEICRKNPPRLWVKQGKTFFERVSLFVFMSPNNDVCGKGLFLLRPTQEHPNGRLVTYEDWWRIIVA